MTPFILQLWLAFGVFLSGVTLATVWKTLISAPLALGIFSALVVTAYVIACWPLIVTHVAVKAFARAQKGKNQ